MSTELFLAVLSIPSRNGRINVGRVEPPRARSSCGAGIQSVAMAERVEPAVSGPPSCHHQATRCADPTRIQLKPGGQEDLNAASGESSAFALPRRIPTASALKGMRSFVTGAITRSPRSTDHLAHALSATRVERLVLCAGERVA